MRLHSVIAIVAVLSTASSLQGREWTDSTGRHRSEAELVRRAGDTVWLKDSTGRRRWVDFQRLSAADQDFIIQHEVQGARNTKPQLVVNTLGYRQTKPVSENSNELLAAAADTSVFKLTGWSHCTPWYCHHPHPHPHHPVLPNPLPVPSKRIYCGNWSTWHLVRQQKGAISGTGTYLVNIPPITRHLVLLNYLFPDSVGLVYSAVAPPPSTILYWRFGNSVVGSCWYRVEYWNSGWHLYEYCRVKLPG